MSWISTFSRSPRFLESEKRCVSKNRYHPRTITRQFCFRANWKCMICFYNPSIIVWGAQSKMFTESFFLSKLLLRGLLTFLVLFRYNLNKLFRLEIEIWTRSLIFLNKRFKSLDLSLRQYHWKIPVLTEACTRSFETFIPILALGSFIPRSCRNLHPLGRGRSGYETKVDHPIRRKAFNELYDFISVCVSYTL